MALAEYRLRVSALQPAAGADGGKERRAAAPADETVKIRTEEAGGHRAESRRPLRARQALSAAIIRRPGAARRHRPRHRHRPDSAPLRRADGRSRPQGGRRDSRPAPVTEPRPGQDDCDGHARPASSRTCPPDAAPRKGRIDASRRHEVHSSHLEEHLAAKVPDDVHAAVDFHRVRAVRHPDDDQVRRSRSASRSPAPTGWC